MPFNLFMSTSPKYGGAPNQQATIGKSSFFGALSSLLGGSQKPAYQPAPVAVPTAPMPPSGPFTGDGCVAMPLEAQVSVMHSQGRMVLTIVIEGADETESGMTSAPMP